MRTYAGLTIALVGIMALPPIASAATYRFSATAQTLDGQPLYRERHRIEGDCSGDRFRASRHTVDYVSMNSQIGTKGEAFANKTLKYEYDPQRPSVDFKQPLYGDRTQVTNIKDEKARIVLNTQEVGEETYTVPLSPEVVIDSGFVHLIRDSWPSLTSGGQANFQFVAPTRGEAYSFVAEPEDNEHIDAFLELSMEPSQIFLDWMVDSVHLGFDAQGRITDYRGLGNIRKSDDQNYTVHLRYDTSEPPCPLLPR